VSSRNSRTLSKYIGYGLYFYFSGLSLRKAADRLSADCFIKRNHLVSVWNWIQKYNLQKITSKKKKISEYVIDETVIKVGQEYIWLWVAIEPTKDREILAISISKERNMFVAEHFLPDVVDEYGPHPVYTDGGSWYPLQACRFLKLNHHIHSTFEKSLIERTKCSTKG
jgi:putative transposase